MSAIKKSAAQAAMYTFNMLWTAGAHASGTGGNVIERLDPFCKTGETRQYITGYEQAMLAATCDILQKEGCVFPSMMRNSANQGILYDFITAIRTAKVFRRKGTKSEEKDS